MRILFIVPYVPTPIRVRPYNLIKNLVARGHRLTLATLWSSPGERQALAELEALGVRLLTASLPRWRSLFNCLAALPGPLPLQAVYCRSRPLRLAIERELVDRSTPHTKDSNHALSDLRVLRGFNYDVVHVEHLRGTYYGLGLEGVRVVWDSVDCISHLFEQAARDSGSLSGRLMTRLDLARTRRYEGWLVGQFARVLVTSRTDALALEELALQEGSLNQAEGNGRGHLSGAGQPIVVLPNGVDLEYFRAAPPLMRVPDTLVMTGKMSYHANVTAALYLVHRVMPLVWRVRPQVKVILAGANPPASVWRLAAEFPGKVQVTGQVPDLRPYLYRAAVAVAPVRYGAGIQNKVLEAMACGAPVVATPQACTALQTVAGQDLLVGQDSTELARAVLSLLSDPELAARLGAAGRRYVERHHDWHVVAAYLEDIYREVSFQRRAHREPQGFQ